MSVKSQPVGTVSIRAPLGSGPAARVITQNPITADVREIKVLTVPDRPLGGRAYGFHDQLEFPWFHHLAPLPTHENTGDIAIAQCVSRRCEIWSLLIANANILIYTTKIGHGQIDIAV